jgi:hypothetical protein
MKDSPKLESLLLAREDAVRALERGDDAVEYRGYTIEIEDDEWGWTYVLDDEPYGEPLETVFREIDERSGSSEEEIKSLEVAWAARLEVRR